MATPISELFVKISADSSGFEQGIDNATGKADDFTRQMLGGIAKIAAGFLTMQKIGDGIEYNKMAEQAEIAFTTMLGSAEKAQKLIKEMVDFAKTTPFDFPGVRDAGKQLLAFGISADDIIPTLKMLGDVGAGIGAPIGDLAYLFGTIATSGRAMTMDINQFANRGIPIWEELAKITGKNGEELRKMVEAGKIGFPEIEKAFQNMSGEGGKFFNLMTNQSNSFAGALSNMQDTFDLFLGNMTAGAMKPLQELMRGVTKSLEDTTDNFSELGTTAGKAIGLLSPILTGALKAIDAMPPGLTATAVAAVAVGVALGPWGALLGGALALILQISDHFEKTSNLTRDKAVAEYWSGVSSSLGLANAEAKKFNEQAEEISWALTKFRQNGQTGSLTNTSDWTKILTAMKDQYGLTSLQLGEIIKKTKVLTAQEQVAAAAAVKAGAEQEALIQSKIAAEDAAVRKINDTRQAEQQREREAQARSTAEKTRQDSIVKWLEYQDTLKKNGLLTEEQYYKNRIEFQTNLINEIIKEGSAQNELSTSALAEIEKRKGYIAGYTQRLKEATAEEVKIVQEAQTEITEIVTLGDGTRLKVTQDAMDKTEDVIAFGWEAVGQQIKDSQDTTKADNEKFWSDVQSTTSTYVDALSKIADAFGLDQVSKTINDAGDTITGVARVMTNPGDIGGWAEAISGAVGIAVDAFNYFSGESEKEAERAKQAEIKAIEETARRRLFTKLETLEAERDAEISSANEKGAKTFDAEIYWARQIALAKMDINAAIAREQEAVRLRSLAVTEKYNKLEAEAATKAYNSLVQTLKESKENPYADQMNYNSFMQQYAARYNQVLSSIMQSYSDAERQELENLEKAFAMFGERAEKASDALTSGIIKGLQDGKSKQAIKNALIDQFQEIALESAIVSSGLSGLFDSIGAEIGRALDDGITTELEQNSINTQINTALNNAEKIFNAAEATFTKFRVQTTEEIEEAAKEQQEIYNSSYWVKLGDNLSKGIADAFTSSSTKTDFKDAIFEMLEKMAIEAAIVASGISSMFEEVGQLIASAMADGFSSGELISIEDSINMLYEKAVAQIAPIEALFNADAYKTSTSSSVAGGVNVVINSPTAVSPAEASRILTNTMQNLAFAGAI